MVVSGRGQWDCGLGFRLVSAQGQGLFISSWRTWTVTPNPYNALVSTQGCLRGPDGASAA